MRPVHILILLLVLVAIGSQLYVQLQYDYADAPDSVKRALVLGAGAVALLALLVGPRVLRGRGAVVLPLLALLVLASTVATSTAAETITVKVQPGETWSYTLPPGYWNITLCYTASRDIQYPTTRGVITISGQAWTMREGYYAWAPWKCLRRHVYSSGNITITVHVDGNATVGTSIRLSYEPIPYCCGYEYNFTALPGGAS